jgi:hypothetical protein
MRSSVIISHRWKYRCNVPGLASAPSQGEEADEHALIGVVSRNFLDCRQHTRHPRCMPRRPFGEDVLHVDAEVTVRLDKGPKRRLLGFRLPP